MRRGRRPRNGAHRIRTDADVAALRLRAEAARAYSDHPALLRLRELEVMAELAKASTARLYIGFDKHVRPGQGDDS